MTKRLLTSFLSLVLCLNSKAQVTNGLNGGTVVPFYPSALITNLAIINGSTTNIGSITNGIAYVAGTGGSATNAIGITNGFGTGTVLTNSTNYGVFSGNGAALTNLVNATNLLGTTNVFTGTNQFSNNVVANSNIVIKGEIANAKIQWQPVVVPTSYIAESKYE